MSNNKLTELSGEIYSTPVARSVILEKHEAFANQISQTFDDSPYCFKKTNLKSQIQYRMVSLVSDPISDQVISIFFKIFSFSLFFIRWIEWKCLLN